MKEIDGKALREKRITERLSAGKLAKKINVKQGNIYKWEIGHQPQTKEDYDKIQAYLSDVKPSNGVPEDYKKKYYDLLEKYIALLEKQNK